MYVISESAVLKLHTLCVIITLIYIVYIILCRIKQHEIACYFNTIIIMNLERSVRACMLQ